MAISFGGTGQYLRRTTNLPPATAWTLAGWFRVRSVRASQYQYFIDLDDGNNYAVVGYQAAGGWDIGTSGGAATNPTGPAINTWTYIACTLAGAGANNFRVYHATPYASAFVVATSAGASFTPTEMYVGNDFADEWCNVDAANIMVWSAVLTEYELWRQMRSARPLRWQNLNLWSPLRTLADVGDYSGNSNHWSVGGTLAGVDGPPLAWQRTWFVPFAVAGAAAQNVAPGLVANTAGACSVTVTAGAAALQPGFVPNAATVYAASVGANATTLQLGAIPIAPRIYAVALSAGPAAVTPAAPPAAAQVRKVEALARASIGGVVTAAGRYFATSSTGAIVLAGFHTWADVSDTGSTYPPTAFDWPAYLAALVAAGGNYTKLWMMESARDWGDASPLYFAPLPWARTGPGNAADGRPKFDLTAYDATYFERLRERAILAGNAGVYVCVQLFQGWHIESKGLTYNPWTYHPFNSANNINGVNGDANADGKGLETRLTTSTAIYNLQKAYVDKVLDTVGDLDNVIFEISNEDHNDSWDWQVALMGYIRTAEAGRAKQHLVGLTVCWPTTNNSQLAASAADWVSYADTDTTPDATTSGPVSAYDTDHNPNLFTTGRGWVWKALTRGHGGLWLMDEWAGETYGHDTRADSAWNVQRANLGYALDYAARIDLANATAQGGLSSTGYALAKTAGRYQVLAYQDGSGSFTVNLTGLAGTFSVEWLRPQTGATQAGSNVSGGAVRTLTPPWSGEDAVALLQKLADELTLALVPIVRQVHAVAVQAGTVSVTPACAPSAANVMGLAVTAGPVTLQPQSGTPPVQVLAVTALAGAVTMTPAGGVNTTQLLAVAVAAGPVGVTPAGGQSTALALAFAVQAGTVTVTPGAVASASQARSVAAVAGAVTLQLAGAAMPAPVCAVVVTAGTVLHPECVPGAAGVYQVTVMAQAVTVSPSALPSANQVRAVTVGATGTTLQLDCLPAGATVLAVALQAGPVNVYPAAPPAAAVVCVVSVGATGTTLQLATVLPSPQALAVAVVAGPAVVTPEIAASGAAVQPVTVQAGAVSITPAGVSSVAPVYPLTITAGAVLQLACAPSTVQVCNVAVMAGTVAVTPGAVPAAQQVCAVLVTSGMAQYVTPSAAPSVAQVLAVALFGVPVQRIYRVGFDNRVWSIEFESRTYQVQED